MLTAQSKGVSKGVSNSLDSLTGATVFETRRLRCRRFRETDAKALFEVYGDPEGSRWVGDGQPIEFDECEQWLRVTAANYESRGYGMFALDDRGSSHTIGFCGLVHPGGQTDTEVKYAFARPRWGHGLASEALGGLLDHARNALGKKALMATVAAEHLASQRVLVRGGFRFASVLLEDDGDSTFVYRLASQIP